MEHRDVTVLLPQIGSARLQLGQSGIVRRQRRRLVEVLDRVAVVAGVVAAKPLAVVRVGGTQCRLHGLADQHHRETIRRSDEVDWLRFADGGETVHADHVAVQSNRRAAAHAFRNRGIDLILRHGPDGRLLVHLAALVRRIQRGTGNSLSGFREADRENRRANADITVASQHG